MAVSPELLMEVQRAHHHDDVSSRLAQVIQTQGEVANAGLSIADVLRLVTSRSQELMGATGAVVELVEDDEMVCRAVTGAARDMLGLRISRSGSLSGLCVDRGKILICSDSELDSRVDREGCRNAGVRSIAVVPVIYGGATLGVLKVLDSRPEAYSLEDATVLQLMAGMIATSMAHAHAYEIRENQSAEIAYLATHDGLTGLANRSLVFDRLRFLFGQHKRHGEGVGLVMLDVNQFTRTNEHYGHRAGDEVLRWIAKQVSEAAREVDLAARLAGDEFVVVLAPPIDEAGMHSVLGRLVEQTRGMVDVDGQRIHVSTSTGAALASDVVNEPEALMAAADGAMSETKKKSQEGI